MNHILNTNGDNTTTSKKKVFVGMSGGVDSSVAAALLKDQGYDVCGVHIKMWSDPDIPCAFKDDRYDAMRVCAKLDIPFETWDFTKEYRKKVVEYMISEYALGRTPNPDVMCNKHVKFGIFLEHALKRGADYVATGHYVRREDREGSLALLQARDDNKDQSYFLWTLGQKEISRSLFPIGNLTKPEVREIARKKNLSTAEKKDSQGICFIGEIDMNEFLKKYIPESTGTIRTTSGKTIGEHTGLSFFTIGQREGIGIGGGTPYYVAEKDFETNTLVVAEGRDDTALFQHTALVTKPTWISGSEPVFPLLCKARSRYRQKLVDVTVTKNPDGNLLVDFLKPERAVTPGQSIVFYDGDPFDSTQGRRMLGGGVIVQ